MDITIKEKTIKLKFSFRSLLIYENLRGMAFQPKNLTDILWLFYSVVLASGMEKEYTFEEFVEWLDEDENQSKLTEFSDWLVKTATINKNIENHEVNAPSENEIIEAKKK